MGWTDTRKAFSMTPITDENVLLVIPLYNHGETIRDVVQKSLETEFPVLVVDDGSTDKGIDTLSGLNHTTICFDENRGKGLALLTAIEEAALQGYKAIITIDADGQHDPSDAHILYKKAKQSNWPALIIGARKMDQETVPGSSLFGRDFSNFWVRLECGLELADTQSGLRLYPVKETLLLGLSHSRYDFEIEVIVKSAWAGITIDSVPVSVHYPKAEERISHFHKFKDNLRLSLLHTSLIFRRLLPLPHKKLVRNKKKESVKIITGNPWKILKNICREYSSPFFLAVAVWLGIFMGALPLLACHTIAIIYVAHRFHLNKVAAVAASQFCMPPVVPVLCIQVGFFLQNGSLLLDLSWERWGLEIHYRLWDWFIGSLLIGPILGFVGGIIIYFASKKVHQRKRNVKAVN